VTVKAGDAEDKPFTVVQNPTKNTLNVSGGPLNFKYNETTAKDLTVTTNASSYSVSRPSDATAWLQITLNGSKTSVRPTSNNTSSSARTARLTFEAGTANPVTVDVTQEPYTPPTPTGITYNNALGYYLGDIGTGTGAFVVDLYSNVTSGLELWGFCDKPSSASSFRLSTGTYSIGSTGANRTYLGGQFLDGDHAGTTMYNTSNGTNTVVGQHIFITGGTFTVALSGTTYTITTNFTGRNSATGATVTNIQAKYTGSISFFSLATGQPFGLPKNNDSVIERFKFKRSDK